MAAKRISDYTAKTDTTLSATQEIELGGAGLGSWRLSLSALRKALLLGSAVLGFAAADPLVAGASTLGATTVTTLAASGAITGSNGLTISSGTTAVQALTATTIVTSSTINGQTISSAASFTGTITVASGLTVSSGNVGLTAGSVTLANGQYYKATRTTGGLVINLLGIEAGTDRTLMTTTGTFVLLSGGGAALLEVTTAGVATITGGLTVSAGTTAVQALTATTLALSDNLTITKAGSATVTLRRSGSATGSAYVDFGNTAGRWAIGVNVAGTGNAYEVYNSGLASVAVSVASATNAVTFSAGVSATGATISGTATVGLIYTSHGTTNVPTATSSTIYTMPGAGLYIVYADLNGSGSDWMAAAFCSSDGTNGVRLGGYNGVALSISCSGLNIQVSHTSGATQGIRWRVLRMGDAF